MKKIALNNTRQMYEDLQQFCIAQKFENSLKSLPYAQRMHEGIYRRGSKEPFLIHPLYVAITLINYGIINDELVSSALLHDTVEDNEDCTLMDLDVLDSIKKRVYLLTFRRGLLDKKIALRCYMNRIVFEGDLFTNYIKDVDRFHNLTTTKGAFNTKKLQEYLDETLELFYPNFKNQKTRFPEGKYVLESLETRIKKQVEMIIEENPLIYPNYQRILTFPSSATC